VKLNLSKGLKQSLTSVLALLLGTSVWGLNNAVLAGAALPPIPVAPKPPVPVTPEMNEVGVSADSNCYLVLRYPRNVAETKSAEWLVELRTTHKEDGSRSTVRLPPVTGLACVALCFLRIAVR
jgi:hypothetical protein